MNVSVGRIIYTQMLNDEAETEGDITFTRISEMNLCLLRVQFT